MVWDSKGSRKARKRTKGGGWAFLGDRCLVRLDPLFHHGRCIRGVEFEESMILGNLVEQETQVWVVCLCVLNVRV
jgi:hypothetical protein